MENITLGVLALQGCVEPHRFHLEGNGAQFREVRQKSDLGQIHGLIIPGGESTTMLKLIKEFQLEESLRKTFDTMPVWGICAGAILIARQIQSPSQQSFGLIDMTVQRNGYGSQRESFNAEIKGTPVAFIRAPVIKDVGAGVEIKGDLGGHPVWVQTAQHMATTFHPELFRKQPSPLHKLFIDFCRQWETHLR